MTSLRLHKLPFDGLTIIEREVRGDERGSFERFFCHDSLAQLTRGKKIHQINRSFTAKKGTVRGLHFQYPPSAENKIVTCVRGEIWDIAVDLRRHSKTFLRHHPVVLSAQIPRSYFIPEGFAHGFQTLTDDCEIIYVHTANYDAENEGALNALDPALAIKWPQAISTISKRDKSHALIADNFTGFEFE